MTMMRTGGDLPEDGFDLGSFFFIIVLRIGGTMRWQGEATDWNTNPTVIPLESRGQRGT